MYQALDGIEGIPKFYGIETEGDYRGMAIEILGSNLNIIMKNCGGRFEVATVMKIAEQTISRLQSFHDNGFIHRDIKPENFVIGKEKKNGTIYVIDYGLVKRYRDSRTKTHIELIMGKKLTGTARYSSLNTHMGYEQSRRDDMECLAYTFIYLAKGELPWKRIQGKNRDEKYNKIGNMKSSIPIEIQCKGLPTEFVKYLRYCRNLGFRDKPDYNHLKEMFATAASLYNKGGNPVLQWLNIKIDVNPYPKSERPINMQYNDSSNKAVRENNENGLVRPKSKDSNKIELEKAKPRKSFLNLAAPDKMNYLKIEETPVNKAITENSSKTGSFVENQDNIITLLSIKQDLTKQFSISKDEEEKKEIAKTNKIDDKINNGAKKENGTEYNSCNFLTIEIAEKTDIIGNYNLNVR